MSVYYELELLRVRAGLLRLQNEQDKDQREVDRIRAPFQPKPRGCWARPWLLRRTDFGIYEKLMEELRVEDEASFKNMLRVSPRIFQKIVDHLSPCLEGIQGSRFGGRLVSLWV